MKKILFVIQSLYNGGAERSLVNLLHELPADKYEIDLLLFRREGMFLSQVPSHVKVLDTPYALRSLYAPLRRSGIYSIPKFVGTVFARLVKKRSRDMAAFRWKHFYSKVIPTFEKKYDLAIAYISGEVLYFTDEKVMADRKIVWIHNDYRTAGHPKKYDYPHIRNMDAIVSISQGCVDILNEEFPEFQDRIYNIPNLTSSAMVRNRAEAFYPQEYKGHQNVILSIGRLSYQKGFDMAVAAAGILKRKKIPFQWFIIGTGDDQKALEELILKHQVSDCFVLLGARSNPYPYIANTTLLVQSSRYEGKSVVLDEAKILAKPLVVTNYPTVFDQIEDGEEGIVTEMNPDAIANAIEKVLQDSDLRDRLSNNLLSKEYGNQEAVREYERLFDI